MDCISIQVQVLWEDIFGDLAPINLGRLLIARNTVLTVSEVT